MTIELRVGMRKVTPTVAIKPFNLGLHFSKELPTVLRTRYPVAFKTQGTLCSYTTCKLLCPRSLSPCHHVQVPDMSGRRDREMSLVKEKWQSEEGYDRPGAVARIPEMTIDQCRSA